MPLSFFRCYFKFLCQDYFISASAVSSSCLVIPWASFCKVGWESIAQMTEYDVISSMRSVSCFSIENRNRFFIILNCTFLSFWRTPTRKMWYMSEF